MNSLKIEKLIEEGDKEKLRQEIEKSNTKFKDPTLLFGAIATKSKLNILKILIEKGLEKNQMNTMYQNNTLLQFALKNSYQLDVIRYLISKGSDPKARDPLDNSTLLHDCVELQLPFEYVQFFSQYDLINVVNDYGETALTYALSSDITNFEIITFLIKEGSPLDTRNQKQQTPLHVACENDIERDLIELVIKKGSNLNVKDMYKNTPLNYLMPKRIGKRTLEIFFEYGQDMQVKDNFGNTLLHWCCLNNLELMEFLLQIGVDPSIQNNNGETALHILLKNRKCELHHVQLLLKYKINTNLFCRENKTALHSCFSLSNVFDESIVQEILLKTDLSCKNNDNQTFLHYAILHNASLSLVQSLIQQGVPLNEVTKKKKWNSLHFACNRLIDKNLIQLLVEKQVDCSLLDECNHYPIHYLFKNPTADLNLIEICELLYKNDMDLDIKTNSDLKLRYENRINTALLFYTKYRKANKETIRWLIQHGVDLSLPLNKPQRMFLNCVKQNVDYNCLQFLIQKNCFQKYHMFKRYNSPMHHLARKGELEKLKLLISAGGMIETLESSSNETLLHAAVFSNASVCEYLIKEGIDINAQNFRGKTGINIVCQHHLNPTILKVLLENKADYTIKDNNNKTPIMNLLALSYAPYEEIIHYLNHFKDYGMDFQAVDIEMDGLITFCLNWKHSILLLNFFLENGVNIEHQTEYGDDIFTYSLHSGNSLDTQAFLIYKGADFEFKNLNVQDITYVHNASEVEKNYRSFKTIQQDFEGLYTNKLFADFEIKELKIHKKFVETRIGEKISKELIKKFEKFKKSELNTFFKFVYSCKRIDDDQEKKIIISVLKELNLNQKIDLEKFFKRKTFITQMKLLYKDEDSMDFALVVEKKRIPVHKFVLCARSNLFRQMFENINNGQLSKVNDYSGKSYESLVLLIKYLYTDELVITADTEMELLLEEFEDIDSYYQLNENSSIKKILKLENILFEHSIKK
ncbi:ankyrin repeat [Anaeramoeba flamelloides]|uniref:Ankyrin repeat n=1 Tax=Anaeramoeba flamelloides TaxID=1746091 RepID=A0ABQ8XN95_9EUKA|nr:ankyrin repeat [Anaeramoeba flamelloides]